MKQPFKYKRPTANIALAALVMTFLLGGCDFIRNAFTYKDKTQQIVELVLKEDYDKVFDQLAMNHEAAKNADRETIKSGFINFRANLVSNFGQKLDYRFIKSEKVWSTESGESTDPNTTVAYIEFFNESEFGVFKVTFDDVSGKVLSINMANTRESIPDMTMFWLFGILALGVLGFNIMTIRLIKRSNLKRKWLKYMGVVLLNVPTLGYAAVGGLSFKLLHFQFMLGFSFSYLGYSGSVWQLGIPLGGLYWFFKLRDQPAQPLPVPANVELTDTQSQLQNSENQLPEG